MNKLQKIEVGNIFKDVKDNIFIVVKEGDLYSLKNIEDGSFYVKDMDYMFFTSTMRYERTMRKVKSSELSNKEYIACKFQAEDYIIGCYDKIVDSLAKVTINKIIDSALSYDWTDLLITSKGKKYIVEISTVDREKDIQIRTPKEYEEVYGRKYGEEI